MALTVIYGDILFIVNLYVDYFILLAVKSFLHLRAGGLRLLLGSAAGAAFSLLALVPLPSAVTFLCSLFFSPVICLIAFAPMGKAGTLKASACFYSFSFILSGLILLLSQMTAKAAVIGGKPYFDISPLFLFLFTALSYFVSLLIDKIRGSRSPDSLFYKIIIVSGDCKAELLAKVDTGNTLKEPFSGTPVIVAEKSALKAFPTTEDGFRLIPFNSIGGDGLLPAFRPDKIYLKKSGKLIDCYLALFDGRLSAGSWNCLLNTEIINLEENS